MKKLALILAFVMCFTSTMFFSGCNNLNPTIPNTNQTEVEDINKSEETVTAPVGNTIIIDDDEYIPVYTKDELVSALRGAGSNILLCNSIEINDSWKPNDYSNSTFNGQGYTITFKPTTIRPLQSNFAFFKNTYNSTIKNLTIIAEVQAYDCAAALVCLQMTPQYKIVQL